MTGQNVRAAALDRSEPIEAASLDELRAEGNPPRLLLRQLVHVRPARAWRASG